MNSPRYPGIRGHRPQLQNTKLDTQASGVTDPSYKTQSQCHRAVPFFLPNESCDVTRFLGMVQIAVILVKVVTRGSRVLSSSFSGSRRSLDCAGANTLENQSWRVCETRFATSTVVSRRLATTLNRCRWKTQAKDQWCLHSLLVAGVCDPGSLTIEERLPRHRPHRGQLHKKVSAIGRKTPDLTGSENGYPGLNYPDSFESAADRDIGLPR